MTTTNTTPKRQIHNPEYFVGKRIDCSKWEMPDGYNLCEKTRKFHPESALGISFDHYAFEKSWLLEKGIYVEDAAWLSEEGYDEITAVLEREGVYAEYIERAWSSKVLIAATTTPVTPVRSVRRGSNAGAYRDTPKPIEKFLMNLPGKAAA